MLNLQATQRWIQFFSKNEYEEGSLNERIYSAAKKSHEEKKKAKTRAHRPAAASAASVSINTMSVKGWRGDGRKHRLVPLN